jgi:hypothetical protein
MSITTSGLAVKSCVSRKSAIFAMVITDASTRSCLLGFLVLDFVSSF